MLLSVYDPVSGRIVYGAQAQALRAQGGGAPASPAMAAPPAARPMQLPTPAAASPAAVGGSTIIRPQGNSASVSLPQISVTAPQDAPPAATPAPASNAGGGMMRQPLGAYFQQLEQERGLPSGYLAKVRAIESSNGTNLANPNSSARGDFQFIRSTAKQYGIDPMDPYQSARAAADMAASNMQTMQAKGINPDGADLYAAHQQGIGGYLDLRGGQGTGRNMDLNGGAGMSPSQFLGKWRTAYANAKPGNLGDGFTPNYSEPGANQGQGPTVAAAQAQGGVQNANPAPTAAAAPSDTYKGGLLGLAGIGDPNAPGMSKDFSGKMSDMLAQPGGGAIGALGKALPALFGGGAPTRQPIQFGPAADAHAPDASMLAYLDPRKRNQGVL